MHPRSYAYDHAIQVNEYRTATHDQPIQECEYSIRTYDQPKQGSEYHAGTYEHNLLTAETLSCVRRLYLVPEETFMANVSLIPAVVQQTNEVLLSFFEQSSLGDIT